MSEPYLSAQRAAKKWVDENWGWIGKKGLQDLSDDRIAVALLTKISVELEALNRLLGCNNFRQISMVLKDIRRAVQPKKSKKRKAPVKPKRKQKKRTR